ncbi:MAG: CPBP family intramembrane metalloprotease [Roseburia sp.]|nr:CPBP family intramembrane metalloprotease [Roseburia sp.]
MLRTGAEKRTYYDYDSSCMFYLCAIVVGLVCQAAAGLVAAALADKYPNISQNGNFNTAFMIVVQIANGAFIVLFSRLCGKKIRPTFFKSTRDVKTDVLYIAVPVVCAAVLMIGMYLPTVWYGYFIHDAVGVPWSAGEIELDGAASVVMIVIASVLLAPVCEETIYRGVLCDGLEQRFSAVKAALLSALAFMLMHMSPMQVVFQFALGALSAFIIIRTKRILPSVVLHACANALALVMQMTALGDVLNGCVEWLTRNIAAAFFITLALFVCGGALLYVLVRFLLKRAPDADDNARNVDNADSVENASAQANGQGETDSLAARQAQAAPVLDELKKKDGTFKYWTGVGLCAIMFVINLIVSVL